MCLTISVPTFFPFVTLYLSLSFPFSFFILLNPSPLSFLYICILLKTLKNSWRQNVGPRIKKKQELVLSKSLEQQQREQQKIVRFDKYQSGTDATRHIVTTSSPLVVVTLNPINRT